MDGCSMKFAPESIKGNKSLVLVAAQQSGKAIVSTGDRFLDDNKVALAAVSNGYQLSNFSHRIRSNSIPPTHFD